MRLEKFLDEMCGADHKKKKKKKVSEGSKFVSPKGMSIKMWANSINYASEKFDNGEYKLALKALEDTKKALPKLIKMVKERM